ncbi:MAG: hypothetical protein KAR21_10050, partial [Spirochaetales bacterium]|nr:hypothetical protein [Spirochaetales bacterium]
MNPGSELYNGEILLDEIYNETGGEVVETLYLVPGNGSLQMISTSNQGSGVVDGSAVTESTRGISASFLRNGIKHSYTLSTPERVLSGLPSFIYDNEVLDAVTADYNFAYFPSYSSLSISEYNTIYDSASEEDKVFLEDVYNGFPEIPPVTQYDLASDITDSQVARLLLIFDFLSDVPDSVLDNPLFLSGNRDSVGIIALSEAEYTDYFEGNADIQNLFDEVVNTDLDTFYILKNNITETEKNALETAARQYLRDVIEFPYYVYNEAAGEYNIKDGLGSSDRENISVVFSGLGLSVFTTLNRSIRYFSDAVIPVYYDGILSVEAVDNDLPSCSAVPEHKNPGAVRIPYFDIEGR